MEPDPFDDVLGLEDRFYAEGYQLGLSDGEKSGRTEGRIFGLEKGLEKYVEIGKLHGRSRVWLSRLPNQRELKAEDGKPSAKLSDTQGLHAGCITNLPDNPRLEKHIRVLYALTEPVSLSTENNEDAVSDFDDRLRRAQGKVKIIERLVREDSIAEQDVISTPAGSGSNIEDVNILKARH